MITFKLNTFYEQILTDTLTPVSIYLKLRDKFPNSLLLESSDYHVNNNSFSYICCNPIASIRVENETIFKTYPDQSTECFVMDKQTHLTDQIEFFVAQFQSEIQDFKFITNGLFGYINYDAVRYFEKTTITKKPNSFGLPDMYYAVYQNIIAINHFKNEAYLFCHSVDNKNNIPELIQILQTKSFATYSFKKQGDKTSNCSDQEFRNNIQIGKEECKRGNVFQIVFSRRFSQQFLGDDFNVYRALRSINPSPYLFYFDYGNFKLFGSSPEAQLVVQDRKAEIHPIAGTFKRTGNDEQDALLAKKLTEDQKENSEHVMLVDLARNDLSRNGSQVRVEKFREVQFFSHVIHLVSKVTSRLHAKVKTMQVVADTFPAGTLTGAPKHKALEIINSIETTNRGFYGGSIGFMDFNGNFNHAIMIRTFLSKNHTLHYQAGAGIVENSIEENELNEVYHKLTALDKAIEMATNL